MFNLQQLLKFCNLSGSQISKNVFWQCKISAVREANHDNHYQENQKPLHFCLEFEVFSFLEIEERTGERGSETSEFKGNFNTNEWLESSVST